MDSTTFEDPGVKAALDRYVKVKVQAEDPDAEPARSLLARFKSVGPPTWIAASDFTGAEARLAALRSEQGLTPEWLEAYSWLGRGHLASDRLDDAEHHARQTYAFAREMLKTRDIDTEPRLPIAYGAAVEVLGQVEATRGARTDAIVFLERERDAHTDTSVVKRIQKNINLLGLEGTKAPGIVATEYLGPRPPSMEDLESKVVLLFFWAHWCSDCKKMAPVLAQLDAQYRATRDS